MRKENGKNTLSDCETNGDVKDSPLYFCGIVDEKNDGFLIEQVMISQQFGTTVIS